MLLRAIYVLGFGSSGDMGWQLFQFIVNLCHLNLRQIR